MNNMKIEVENGKAKLFTPYNPTFVTKIKGIGSAKWNSEDRCWMIPEENIEEAREIMRSVYGAADNDVAETVKVKVTVLECVWAKRRPYTLMGKVLSKAYGRDSDATPGEDVAYISGYCRSGGSVKNWESQVDKGSVIVLSNVNKTLYELYLENPNEDLKVELMESKKSKNELLKEKEQLLERLNEIEKELFA